MKIKSLRKIKDFKGKKVLLRVDFNVPMSGEKVDDGMKIVNSLATIKYLQRYGAKIIIVSHLGRPSKEKKDFSLLPISQYLGKLIGQKIIFLGDFRTYDAGSMIASMKEKDIAIIENIRYYEEEEKNGSKFAKELANLCDIYINNAFAVSHRKHASLSAIKKYLPSYAGLLLEKEIKKLNKILKSEPPFLAIVGGAKIATKLKLIKRLAKRNKDSKVLIGGALANTFLLSKGFAVGKSLVDKKYLKMAKKFCNSQVILPVDAVVKNSRNNKVSCKAINSISKDDYIYDIGPETIKLFSSFIVKARTIVWNGPLGLFEEKNFKNGTVSVARLVASRSRTKVFGVVGGGETVEALKMTKMQDYVDWISTGGGAMLSYLGGEKMPGLEKIIK